MEKFDIENFEKIKQADEATFVTEDNNFITLSENDESYQQDWVNPDIPIKQTKLFYKDTLNLKKEGEFFQDVAIGVLKTYDENGELIEEINYDLPYTFSLEDVRQKILNEFGKDIMDGKQLVGVIRNTEPSPHYFILIRLANFLRSDSRLIQLDGETGEILSDTLMQYTED